MTSSDFIHEIVERNDTEKTTLARPYIRDMQNNVVQADWRVYRYRHFEFDMRKNWCCRGFRSQPAVGAVATNAKDMAKWMNFMLSGGKTSGKSIKGPRRSLFVCWLIRCYVSAVISCHNWFPAENIGDTCICFRWNAAAEPKRLRLHIRCGVRQRGTFARLRQTRISGRFRSAQALHQRLVPGHLPR